jgi:putative SOS response-associated peptidase YedK
MCGRFTLTIHHFGSVIESLEAVIEPELLAGYRPRYNVAPGQQHWILRSESGRREIVPADWGLINSWSKDPAVAYRQINARAETAAERPAFRQAFQKRRCLCPADGFYEWCGPRKAREPHWFHAPDRSLLLFAGLYEGWTDPSTGELKTTFTIITTEANDVVRPVHDRMPVLIGRDRIDSWLTGDRPGELLKPAPVKVLTSQAASSRVNSVRNDDPECLVAGATGTEGQLKLF